MFGKKYTPSIKNNMQLTEKLVNEITTFIYRVERGRVDSDAEQEELLSIISDLKESVSALSNTVGTGEENIEATANKILDLLKDLKKTSGHDTVHRIKKAADDLDYHLNLMRDILDGATSGFIEEEQASKVSYTRRKLNERLSELSDIKDGFTTNSRRLEKEIQDLESDLDELNQAIVNEENERKINELFKRINAIKTNIDSLTVRKESYVTCFALLDAIFGNAKEIVAASDFAAEEIGKAKALLDIPKLKKVLSAPEKAIIILKRMQADITQIKDRSQMIDEKIAELNTSSATVNQDALAYKAELMRKKREKEAYADLDTITDSSTSTNTETTTEEKN